LGNKSRNNLNTARYALAGAGTQTAALAFGGTPFTAATEEYNGTSWASVNSMNTAREKLAGCGTQTAGLAFGGNIPPNSTATEEYDGNSWVLLLLQVCQQQKENQQELELKLSALAFGGFSPPVHLLQQQPKNGLEQEHH
jgi:hypothetical protein